MLNAEGDPFTQGRPVVGAVYFYVIHFVVFSFALFFPTVSVIVKVKLKRYGKKT
jgi:hypothetical protein